MTRRRALFLTLLLASASFAHSVSAAVSFSEIKYAGNEWVEVTSSGSPVDLSLWRFSESGTNHKLKLISGSATIPNGGYAIIANDGAAFTAEYPNFSGTLFDSSFTLTDTGETIILKDPDLNTIDTVSYVGTRSSPTSLQKINGTWQEAVPTPGESNQGSVSASVPTPTQNTTPSTPSYQVATQDHRTAFVGVPLAFEGVDATGSSVAQFEWSFGDGATASGAHVSHAYYYSGDYTAVLVIRGGTEGASGRILVHVIAPNIVLDSVGAGESSAIGITNRSTDELNIAGWLLKVGNAQFAFPANTIIPGGRRVVFASQITGLIAGSDTHPSLYFPNGSLVKTESTAPLPETPKVTTAQTANPVSKATPTVSSSLATSPRAPQETLQASTILAVSTTTLPGQGNSSVWVWYSGLAFLVALGLLAVRVTKAPAKGATEELTADDFEILE